MTDFYARQLAYRTDRAGVAVDQVWRGFALAHVTANDGLVISAIGDTTSGLQIRVIRGNYDTEHRPIDDYAGEGLMFAEYLVQVFRLAVPAFVQLPQRQRPPPGARCFWCDLCDSVYVGPDGCDVVTERAGQLAHQRNCLRDRRPAIV